MAGKLTKRDYEAVLSREYGFPVFLNDKEYDRLQVERPAPEMKHAGYQDPFAYVEHKTNAQKDADRAAKWTTKPGVTYSSEHGRKKKPAADASKHDAPVAPVVASPVVGKVAPPEDGTTKKEWGPMDSTPSTFGKPVNAGPTAPVKQDTFTAVDFDIPMAGDPISAKPAPVAAGPVAVMPDLGTMPQWQNDEAEVDQMNAKYAALMAGN